MKILGAKDLSDLNLPAHRFYRGYEIVYRSGCDTSLTAQKMFCFLRIWSHLLKKYLMENFIFCAVSDLTFFAEKMKKDITAHQHDQSIDIRQKNGRITCQFRGDGTYTVSWNRVNSTKLREGIIENKTTLIFNDVQFNDTGTYQCTAVGPKNTANAEIDLEVYGTSFYYSSYFCYNYSY